MIVTDSFLNYPFQLGHVYMYIKYYNYYNNNYDVSIIGIPLYVCRDIFKVCQFVSSSVLRSLGGIDCYTNSSFGEREQ